MNRNIFVSLLFISLFSVINPLVAQDEKELLAQMFAEDREAIDALVVYPKDTRLAILETAAYPQALIKLERIQQKTSTQFKALLEEESKTTQQMIWDLTRYPNLISRLVQEGNKNTKSIEKVLSDYPNVIHKRAKEAGKKHYSLLLGIDELDHSSKQAFETILEEFPIKTQEALRKLIELPEVLSLLTENIQLTILVGDLYKKEPNWLISQTDSLSGEVARMNEEELVKWQEELENDPDALNELKSSTEEFAQEYGYDDLYYDQNSEDDLYYYEDKKENNQTTKVVERHYYHHYPYWYGYPTWYVYPRWRPYPLWWDTGFYYQPNRVMVFYGTPSFYFTNWYFYNPHHHYYYPHLTNRFVNHAYYGPRTHNSNIRVSVNNWQRNNRAVITDEWLGTGNRRVERIKEFGRFESARQTYNRENPNRKVDQGTYLRNNSPRYERLKTRDVDIERSRSIERNPSATKPPVKSDVNRRTERKPTIDRQTAPTKTVPRTTIERRKMPPKTDSNTNIRKIDRGRDYHSRTWENTRKQPARPSVVPKRTTTPPTKVVPRKSTGKKTTTKSTKRN